MPPLDSNGDYYDVPPEGYYDGTLHVTVTKNKLIDPEPVAAADPALPVDVSGVGSVPSYTTGFDSIDKLAGMGGQDRYQTWPEKLIRSATTLPGDVASGAVPDMTGLRREDFTDNPAPGGVIAAQPNDPMIERAQDMAGLAGTAPLAIKPGVASVGSGMVRQMTTNEAAPVFYSAVENAVKNAKQAVATPEQWLGFLKNQPGVKAEELSWLGLDDPKNLGEGKITKSDLENYVQSHKVDLQEVNKGVSKGRSVEEIDREMDIENAKIPPNFTEMGQEEGSKIFARLNELQAERNAAQNGSPTKFSQWQLPGGENYREQLLTLPPTPKIKEQFEVRPREGKNPFAVYLKGEKEHMRSFATKDEADAFAAKQNEHGFETSNDFKSSHWDEPNVLAHVRMNDRNVPDVGKSLHLEEVQSDLHQRGRKHGYIGEKEKLEPEFNKVEQKILDSNDESIMGHPDLNEALKLAVKKNIINQKEAAIYKRYTKIENGTEPVPNMPFKSNWDDLILKRMIREAAEKGYDAISWTPGEAQAARYDLSKHLDSIGYEKRGDKYNITAWGKNGEQVWNNQSATPEMIEENLGKQMAEKVVNGHGRKDGPHTYLEDLDLKVGDEDMKEYYDKILLNKMNDLAKKFGGKVEESNIPLSKIEKEDLKRKLMENTKPDEISLKQYGKQWDELVADKKQIEIENNDPKIKSSTTYKQAGRARINQIEDELNNLHGKSVSDTVDRIIKNTKGKPIHLLKLPPAMKDAALSKGFPLFSSGVMLSPVENNPYQPKLTPVDHNPFQVTPVPGNPFE